MSFHTTHPRPGYTRPNLWPDVLMESTHFRRKSHFTSGKRNGRIKTGIRDALLMAWGWCILVILASYTVAPFLIYAVTASTQEEVIFTASLYLRVDTVLYFVPAAITVFRNALQGIGDCIVPVISSFIELAGKVLIVIFLTPRLAYWGIILAEPIVWVLMVIPLIVRIFTIDILRTPRKGHA